MKQLSSKIEKNVPIDKNNVLTDFVDRITVRAIVLNHQEKIALVGTNKHPYYLLPGGGVLDGESLENAVIRECREEIGYQVKIQSYLGVADDYRDRDKKHNITHCFTASVLGNYIGTSLTENELSNGCHTIWLNPEEVRDHLEHSSQDVYDGRVNFYNTAFNILRDKDFFNIFQRIKEVKS